MKQAEGRMTMTGSRRNERSARPSISIRTSHHQRSRSCVNTLERAPASNYARVHEPVPRVYDRVAAAAANASTTLSTHDSRDSRGPLTSRPIVDKSMASPARPVESSQIDSKGTTGESLGLDIPVISFLYLGLASVDVPCEPERIYRSTLTLTLKRPSTCGNPSIQPSNPHPDPSPSKKREDDPAGSVPPVLSHPVVPRETVQPQRANSFASPPVPDNSALSLSSHHTSSTKKVRSTDGRDASLHRAFI